MQSIQNTVMQFFSQHLAEASPKSLSVCFYDTENCTLFGTQSHPLHDDFDTSQPRFVSSFLVVLVAQLPLLNLNSFYQIGRSAHAPETQSLEVLLQYTSIPEYHSDQTPLLCSECNRYGPGVRYHRYIRSADVVVFFICPFYKLPYMARLNALSNSCHTQILSHFHLHKHKQPCPPPRLSSHKSIHSQVLYFTTAPISIWDTIPRLYWTARQTRSISFQLPAYHADPIGNSLKPLFQFCYSMFIHRSGRQ